MQLKTTLAALLGALALTAQAAHASELDITAEYKGSVSQTVGTFTNTTPSSGFCKDNPGSCPVGYFSLELPWPGNERGDGGDAGTKTLPRSTDPRDGFYLGFNAAERSVMVTNQEGESHEITLLIDAISWGVMPYDLLGPLADFQSPRGNNCRNIAVEPTATSSSIAHGMWGASTPTFTTCYLPLSSDDTDKTLRLDYFSFRYTLKMDKPWTWAPGVYHGSYVYKVGPGQDLDFGNGFQGSTDDVTLKFTLTVKPDMYVKFHGGGPGNTVNADLQPPGGWLDWQSGMPPYLSKEIPFDFGATAPVKIHLECEHAVGDACAIVDQQGGSPLAVYTLLSANRFTDNRGLPVAKTQLGTSERVFTPDAPGGTGVQPARLWFRTSRDAPRQLQRGHQYGGRVTVVFDSDIS